MRISTVQQAFEEFEREHVRVPDVENTAAKKVQQEFRDAMEAALVELYAESFLAGSYRRKTQSEHLKDLDIIIVLNDPTGELRASAKRTLEMLKRHAPAYGPVIGREVKCRAVECELDGYTFWADLVPALTDGQGGLLLAYWNRDTGEDEWRSADPKAQTRACADKNRETNGVYVPVTRTGKYWNQSFTSSPSDEKPVPSYYVEAILHDAIAAECEWAQALTWFFERAREHLQNPRPSIPCPGAPAGTWVDENLDPERRMKAAVKVEEALGHARRAMAEPDAGKAMDHWAKVLGPAFPSPSTHPSLIAEALKGGTARLVGSGVSATPVGRKPIPARSHRRVGPRR